MRIKLYNKLTKGSLNAALFTPVLTNKNTYIMETLKIIVDVKNNNVSFSNSDLTNTLVEAGLSHTDLNDRKEITEYFKERYGNNTVVEFL